MSISHSDGQIGRDRLPWEGSRGGVCSLLSPIPDDCDIKLPGSVAVTL